MDYFLLPFYCYNHLLEIVVQAGQGVLHVHLARYFCQTELLCIKQREHYKFLIRSFPPEKIVLIHFFHHPN